MPQHMGMQALQQVQAAPHALMTGGQQLEGLVEAHGRAGMQDDAGTHGKHCLTATMPP